MNILLKNPQLKIRPQLQASEKDVNDYLAGTSAYEHKVAMAKAVKKLGFSLVFNIVIHRLNIDHMADILEMAHTLNADYVELANTQYYGFAFENKQQLLPTREQLVKAEKIAHEYKERYKHKMKIYYVVPDYYENRPKPCMNGWGSIYMTIIPDGTVLPCHAARVIKELEFYSVRDKSLEWIWYESDAFNHFRGEEWMVEPCRTCPERKKDFGGCRCQAYMVLGDAALTDPVCDLSPNHQVILDIIEKAGEPEEHPLIFRNPKNSKRLS